MNIALIGYGYWGPNIINSFKNTSHPITYVVDKSIDNLNRACAEHAGITPLDDVDKAIFNSEIDALAIALPTGLHYEVAKKAILAGKHVFIEKPMTNKLSLAEELSALAKERGVVLMIDHNYVYKKSIIDLKRLCDLGELGELHYYKSSRLNLGIFRPQDDVIWDLAPHDVAIVKYIMGKNPICVSATASSHIVKGKYDMAQMSLFYENDFTAQFDASWIFPEKVRRSYLGGSRAAVLFDDNAPEYKLKLFPVSYETGDSGVICTQEEPSYLSGDTENAITNAANDFISAIENGKEPISNAAFGCDVVKIIEALEESARLGGKKIYIK